MGIRLTADEIQALECVQNAPALGFRTSTLPDTAKRLVELGFVRQGAGNHPSITDNRAWLPGVEYIQKLFNRICHE
ncbi:hypothetical protein AAKU67_004388 [Oxalobacteraceae bacterium GrIS 2.11]